MNYQSIQMITLSIGLILNSGCSEYGDGLTHERMTSVPGESSREPAENCWKFTYEESHERYTLTLPRRVSAMLEAAVLDDRKRHKREPIPLVRMPLGVFSIRGQEYVWAGYAAVTPLKAPDDEIGLPRCFNLPEDSMHRIVCGVNDPLELGRIFREFFEKI